MSSKSVLDFWDTRFLRNGSAKNVHDAKRSILRQAQSPLKHLSDQGTFTPVGAQGGGGSMEPENHFPTEIL